jgi:hypothetical protein
MILESGREAIETSSRSAGAHITSRRRASTRLRSTTISPNEVGLCWPSMTSGRFARRWRRRGTADRSDFRETHCRCPSTWRLSPARGRLGCHWEGPQCMLHLGPVASPDRREQSQTGFSQVQCNEISALDVQARGQSEQSGYPRACDGEKRQKEGRRAQMVGAVPSELVQFRPDLQGGGRRESGLPGHLTDARPYGLQIAIAEPIRLPYSVIL